MSRLTFKFFLLFIFQIFFSLIPSSFPHLINPPVHDVIIIGGGASGIAALSELTKNNANVLLLEAEDRIGGRINSVKFGDAFVDLGAEWVDENAVTDPVYKKAIEENLLERSNFSVVTYFYSNRKEIPEDLSDKLQGIERQIYNSKDMREGINVAEFVKDKFAQLTVNLKVPEDFPNLLEDMLEHVKHEMLAADGALDWNEPSAKYDSRDEFVESYNWKGYGYKTILNLLLNNPPHSVESLETNTNILLNKKVTKIIWNNPDNVVEITCKDSTEYRARKVIFTASVGVLKSKMSEIFDPTLPEAKRQAIKSLGIGGVGKVFVEYENDWFNKHESIHVFDLIWDKTMRESLDNFKTDDGLVWITDFSAITPEEHNPKVLCLWFDGQTIPFIENLSDEKLIEGIQFALNQFLGHKYDVPKPIKILRSKWYTNENFLGTYSFQTVESRKRASHADLSKPLKNQNGKEVVYFAGEATCPVHYGTVHGAIHTGFREAQNVQK